MTGDLVTRPVSSQVQASEHVQDDKFNQQKQIAEQGREVTKRSARVAKLGESIEKRRGQLPAFTKVADLEGELEKAKAELQQQEIGDKELNDLKDNKAVASRELKSSKKALSSLLVRYMANWREKSLRLDEGYHAIDVEAKIGKLLKDQTVLPL